MGFARNVCLRQRLGRHADARNACLGQLLGRHAGARDAYLRPTLGQSRRRARSPPAGDAWAVPLTRETSASGAVRAVTLARDMNAQLYPS